ncbi:MAG: amino acid adenylation domain-containing protein, partial [bacterium]|nr:amino acid adenylation domain-containing protein [bacterium]
QWHYEPMQQERIKKQEQYWLQQFPTGHSLPLLHLPTDYTRPPLFSNEGSTADFYLEAGETAQLKVLAVKTDTTLFMLVLAAASILFAKLSGREDIILGTPAAARRHSDLRDIIGMFVNTLVLRNYPSGNKTVNRLLAEVKTTSLEAMENQDYPFEQLAARLGTRRDPARNPVFDVMIGILDTEEYKEETGNPDDSPALKNQNRESTAMNNHEKGETEILRHQPAVSKFDLSIDAVDFGQTIGFRFEYCTRLFNAETINRFIRYLKKVTFAILENPDREISSISILSAEEKQQLLMDFNNTDYAYDRKETILDIFEKQVERTPDSIALTGVSLSFPGKSPDSESTTWEKDPHHGTIPIAAPAYRCTITYRQLHSLSISTAHLLTNRGAGPGHIVAVIADRSIEMIAGLLGVLMAGAAYMPISPDSPVQRIHYQLTDNGTRLLLCNPTFSRQFNPGAHDQIFWNGNIIILENVGTQLPGPSRLHRPRPCDPAYIIYTSGSTGLPKGVLVEHRNLAAYVAAFLREFPLNPTDTGILQASAAFDAFCEELFPLLVTGGNLIFPLLAEIIDPHSLVHIIESHQVTILGGSPLLLNGLNQLPHNRSMTSLRIIISGGDVLRTENVDQLIKNVPVHNTYGPTETTVCATYYKHINGTETAIPIGKAIPNYNIHILDTYRRLVPIGVPGEICIGGEGVSRGYLNRVDLTFDKFIPDPHGKNQRLYRTGDLGRWNREGNIQFLGRIDYQVKIRGYRIELEELENRLTKHEAVKTAVVSVKKDQTGDKYLCAYIVVIPGQTVETQQLKEFMATALPGYMTPRSFVFLKSLPVTVNGKIDRKKLPEPAEMEPSIPYTAPRDHMEKLLTETFAAVLGIDTLKVGIDSDFFQMGGHSLKATALISRIHRKASVRLPLATVFSTPTIRILAEYIRNSQTKSLHIAITPVEKKEYYPLSSAQERLYILQQMDPAGTVYNMPRVIPMEGDFDLHRLETLFYTLIRRHESLRTSFHMLEEAPVQRIHANFDFSIRTIASDSAETVSEEGQESLRENYFKDFVKPFNLSQAPLLRAGVIKIDAHRHLLLVDMHHIISDGISQDLMEADLAALYAGESLPPLTLQYKDYACWQYANRLEPAGKENAALQENFWLERLQSPIPQLNLPTDSPRPAVRSFEGDLISFALQAEETRQLQTLVRAEHTTPYMLLLAVFYIWLAKLSGQEGIIVGTPVAGRRHDDLNHIIGMFVNTLALRNFPEDQKSFLSFAKEVKQRTLEDFEHQEYPFEELVEKTLGRRDTSRNPLFDALFTLHQLEARQASPDDTNLSASDKTIPSAAPGTLEHRENLLPQAKFDLTLTVLQKTDETAFLFGYCTALFKPESMRHFISLFKRIVSSVTRSPHTPIADIDLLSQEERKDVLEVLNRTRTPYPREKTIDQLFSTEARETPDAAGVVYGDSVLTYGELEKLSRNLAHHLVLRGVNHENPVAVSAAPSVEVIVAVLAILKAGGAYVPISPTYPPGRQKLLMTDSGARILLTDRPESFHQIPGIHIHPLVPPFQAIENPPELPPHFSNSPAYIIYTSGSTGIPKGAIVEHRSVVRLVKETNFVTFKEGARLLQTGALEFDASTFEIWGSLLNRMTLHLAPKEQIVEASQLKNLLQKHHISTIWLTSPLFNHIASTDSDTFAGLENLLVGGDVLSPAHI